MLLFEGASLTSLPRPFENVASTLKDEKEIE